MSLSGVEKEESPSKTITDELTYKVNIRSAHEISPSVLDSIPVMSYNKGGVMCGVRAWLSISLSESSEDPAGQ